MTVPNLDTGDVIDETWIDAVTDFLNALVDEWPSWTPQFDQGASSNIAKTVTRAKAIKAGRLVLCTYDVQFTGSGTGGNGIVLKTPHTLAAAQAVAGTAHYYDASTGTRYGGNLFGGTPNVPVANADSMGGWLLCEAAS
jgi:hypothetical protein